MAFFKKKQPVQPLPQDDFEAEEDEDVENEEAEQQQEQQQPARPQRQQQPRQLSKEEVADLIEGHLQRAFQLWTAFKSM